MAEDNLKDWQQYFPTYTKGEPEIALAEYQAASNRAQAEERNLAIANGILVISITPLMPLISSLIGHAFSDRNSAEVVLFNLLIFIFTIIFLTAILASFLCELRRAYVHSARKVIVLRRMHGQSYGPVSLVLPNWRLEGADNPFAIRLFPGWKIGEAYPFYALTAILSAAVAYACYLSFPLVGWTFAGAGWTFLNLSSVPPYAQHWLAAIWVGMAWGFLTLLFLRIQLLDLDETVMLLLAKRLAVFLNIDLIPGTQTTLYNARLARYEAIRLKVDFSLLEKFAIFREDRRYMEHKGVDLRAVARAFFQRLKRNKAGGGTTIPQQLARTLYIRNMHLRRFRRKIVEFPLAIWLTARLSKKELLEIYLCSVWFDRGIDGVIKALRHFWGNSKVKIDNAKAFILVERISNMRSEFRADGVRLMLKDCLLEGLIHSSDVAKILVLYEELISAGKIKKPTQKTPKDLLAEFKQ